MWRWSVAVLLECVGRLTPAPPKVILKLPCAMVDAELAVLIDKLLDSLFDTRI